MQFRLLGEVRLLAAGQVIDIGPPRQQAVLAALLVDAGRPVTASVLIDRLWDDNPPTEARNVLYSHLSRLRRALARASDLSAPVEARIARRHAGYLVDVDPELIDLHRFRRLIDHPDTAPADDANRVQALSQALELWGGTPLEAVAGDWAARVRESLGRLRLEAVVQRAQAQLRLGTPGPVIAALPDLIGEYPLAEPLECVLLQALRAAGRDAEALSRYDLVRRRLAEELGADPGPDLRAVHHAILSNTTSAPVRSRPREGAARRPAQLPGDLYCFAGRAGELDRLSAALEVGSGGQGGPARPVIWLIEGTAGIGKTTLAVHWAHQVSSRFPDGQLYVNLRGFDPAGAPVQPLEAVRWCLDAFDVPVHRIPAGLEAQIGLYRSMLADRRVLIVLDNAHDAQQVRPLLPGGPGCAVVVTSRNQLIGLIAEGAQALPLPLPTATESREMLRQRLGPARIAAEPRAVEEITALCARLPLAVAVVAARATAQPEFGLAVLAGELRETRGGLDEFASADLTMDLRAVFSWSYRRLSAEAAGLFRLLGLHPGPDLSRSAAAELAGVELPAVRPLLAELTRANLVLEHRPGRFTFHDLLRAYAAEQAHAVDSDEHRDLATHRVLTYYLHTADQADLMLNPQRDDPGVLEPIHGPAAGTGRQLLDHAQARTWLVEEYPVLLAMIREVDGFDLDRWQLAVRLTRFSSYQGHWQHSVDALGAAVTAAQRLADPRRTAATRRLLGCSYVRLDRFDDARDEFEQALDLYRDFPDPLGQAHTHRHYAWMLERLQRHRQGLPHAERALQLFQAAGDRAGQARALNAVGWFNGRLGDYQETLTWCGQALDLQVDLGDRFGQAETWDSLGWANRALGRHLEAVRCYQAAVELYRAFDDRYNIADTLASLGDAFHAAGDITSAGNAWHPALRAFEELGHPDAATLRAKLNLLNY